MPDHWKWEKQGDKIWVAKAICPVDDSPRVYLVKIELKKKSWQLSSFRIEPPQDPNDRIEAVLGSDLNNAKQKAENWAEENYLAPYSARHKYGH